MFINTEFLLAEAYIHPALGLCFLELEFALKVHWELFCISSRGNINISRCKLIPHSFK